MLIKEIKEDLNKQQDLPCHRLADNMKVVSSPPDDLMFKAIPIKIQQDFHVHI